LSRQFVFYENEVISDEIENLPGCEQRDGRPPAATNDSTCAREADSILCDRESVNLFNLGTLPRPAWTIRRVIVSFRKPWPPAGPRKKLAARLQVCPSRCGEKFQVGEASVKAGSSMKNRRKFAVVAVAMSSGAKFLTVAMAFATSATWAGSLRLPR
jgi:hypothetical protein